MARRTRNGSKLAVAVLCGFIVALIAAGVHLATMTLDRITIVHAMLGDFIAGLTTVVVCLAIQLRQEEVHYRTAIERAAIVAELNHHVRNAIFPLCLAIQKTGDADSIKVANDSVERINLALKDATADALSGRTDYHDGETNTTS